MIKWLAKGHAAREEQSRDLNTDTSAPGTMCLTTEDTVIQKSQAIFGQVRGDLDWRPLCVAQCHIDFRPELSSPKRFSEAFRLETRPLFTHNTEQTYKGHGCLTSSWVKGSIFASAWNEAGATQWMPQLISQCAILPVGRGGTGSFLIHEVTLPSFICMK